MLHVVSGYELVHGVRVALDPRLLIVFADESFVLLGLRHRSYLPLSRPVLARMPPVTRQPVYPASPAEFAPSAGATQGPDARIGGESIGSSCAPASTSW